MSESKFKTLGCIVMAFGYSLSTMLFIRAARLLEWFHTAICKLARANSEAAARWIKRSDELRTIFKRIEWNEAIEDRKKSFDDSTKKN